MIKLVERRSASRFDVSIVGQAETENGFTCSIRIGNISSSGLQLELAQEDAMHLIPQTIISNTLSPVKLTLTFFLDGGKPQSEPNYLPNDKSKAINRDRQMIENRIRIECGIVYIKRKNLERSFVGCRFEKFLHDSSIILEQYLSDIV